MDSQKSLQIKLSEALILTDPEARQFAQIMGKYLADMQTTWVYPEGG